MLTPTANKLPNIDCTNSEVQKLLDVSQSKSRPSSPNPTYADNMTSMDVENTNPFSDDIQEVCNRRFLSRTLSDLSNSC